MRWLTIAALLGICFQALLGGLRVVGDDVVGWLQRTQVVGRGLLGFIGNDVLLRRVHGCTAPALFAVCATLVILTSSRWLRDISPKEHPAATRLRRWTSSLTMAIYLQIVFGAQLRHLAPEAAPGWFAFWVWVKLIAAGLIAMALVWLLIYALRRVRDRPTITRRAELLAALFLVQLLLGAVTWVANYGWPGWFTDYVWALQYTVRQEGPLQVLTTTTHAAVGSLSFAASVSLTLWTFRLLRGSTP
jgi:cytochrome c oxidase assembly protein subunit 15